jgi:hypothetical protein
MTTKHLAAKPLALPKNTYYLLLSSPLAPFHSLNFDEDEDDEQYEPNTSTRDRFKDDEKAVDVLTFMKSKYDRFTLHKLLAAIFKPSASNKVKGFAVQR